MKICEGCGKEFVARKKQKNCSVECSWKARTKICVNKNGICNLCGKENKRKRVDYCLICYKESYNKIKKCIFCTKVLDKKRWKFCSKICSEKYNEKNKWDNRRIEKNLPICTPRMKNEKGSGHIRRGYKVISKKGHPNAMSSRGQLFEHTYVMSEYLGRPLIKGENVHHINGIRSDNRIENLQLWSTSQPPGQKVEDKIKWYIEFLTQYGYKVTKG